jgi:hypothetical protein
MIISDTYNELIELESCTIYKRTDGILVYIIKPGMIMKISDVKMQFAAFLKIQKGEHSPLLVKADDLRQLPPEVKDFMNATIADFATRLAILTNNPLPTFIYRIAFYLTPPPVPSQIFKSETEALEWLKKRK